MANNKVYSEEGKRDPVHHTGAEKALSVRCQIAHNDRDRQRTVHLCVKLVPGS